MVALCCARPSALADLVATASLAACLASGERV